MMRRGILTGLVCSGLLQILCASPYLFAEPPSTTFGVMLGGKEADAAGRVVVARALGVTMVRPLDLSLAEWAGTHEDTSAFLKAGFKVVLTVRHNGKGLPLPKPASPPKDLEAYQKKLGDVLDAYRPELLVVENEENSALYYLGTPKHYGAQLKAACAVARRKGIKCTNGGLGSSLAATLVWSHYRDRREGGRAEDFLRRTSDPSQQKMLRTVEGQRRIGEAIMKGKALLAEYQSAGLDYLNVHWHIPDPAALAETVAYLKAETGLQPIITEMGQRDTGPVTVTALLGKAVELGLPYVVWLSVDRPDAKALHEPNGALRENGRAFQEFVRKETGQAPTAGGRSRQYAAGGESGREENSGDTDRLSKASAPVPRVTKPTRPARN